MPAPLGRAGGDQSLVTVGIGGPVAVIHHTGKPRTDAEFRGFRS